jgi:uncharacterized protein YbaP (TraB family)
MRLLAGLLLMVLAAAPHARAEPAIWMVQSPTAKVYLFGTMHLLPKHVDWFGPKIEAAFAASSVLFEEADIGMIQPQSLAKFMNQAVSPDTDLFHLLPARYAEKFQHLMHSCALPMSVVAHFRPWYAAMLPTICDLIKDSHGDIASKMGPEGNLITRAMNSGKKIDFFETADQQISYLTSAPEKVQIKELEDAIDEGADSNFIAMEESWFTGDVDAIARLVAKDGHDDEETYQTIFVHRNERFAARIETMLQGHDTIFVAIGAGHLAGQDSVQAQLGKKGIGARRL